MSDASTNKPASRYDPSLGLWSELRQIERPLFVALWFIMAVLFFYLFPFYFVGKRALLQRAAAVRPYAKMYLRVGGMQTGDRSAEKLIFFFGDSTLLFGRNSRGQSSAEILESGLRNQYPELGSVSVVRWAFGSATLFHFYCLMFQAEKQSPDLIIIPINWFWFGAETANWSEMHLRQMASMTPISELFSIDKGNPLRQAGISLEDRFLYSLDMYLLCGAGMKIWVREKLDLPPLEKESAEIQWAPLRSGSLTMLCPEHPTVDLIRYIAKTAESRNIRILFYISPRSIEEWLKRGVLDPELLACSVERVLEASATRTTECADLMTLLSLDQFTDGLHYDFSGHRDIADALTPEVYEMLTREARTGQSD